LHAVCSSDAYRRTTISYYDILTFMMPFQLSPVAILNNVRKAAPEFSKFAWTPIPSQGFLLEHSTNNLYFMLWYIFCVMIYILCYDMYSMLWYVFYVMIYILCYKVNSIKQQQKI